jgi:hypothetical protein
LPGLPSSFLFDCIVILWFLEEGWAEIRWSPSLLNDHRTQWMLVSRGIVGGLACRLRKVLALLLDSSLPGMVGQHGFLSSMNVSRHRAAYCSCSFHVYTLVLCNDRGMRRSAGAFELPCSSVAALRRKRLVVFQNCTWRLPDGRMGHAALWCTHSLSSFLCT